MSQFEIIFVRHGEAESSFGTHPDPALSKNGIKQSIKLIEHNELQSLEEFIFISSPKLRAIETAKPIANKFDKKIDIDETFIEIPSKMRDLCSAGEKIKAVYFTHAYHRFLENVNVGVKGEFTESEYKYYSILIKSMGREDFRKMMSIYEGEVTNSCIAVRENDNYYKFMY